MRTALLLLILATAGCAGQEATSPPAGSPRADAAPAASPPADTAPADNKAAESAATGGQGAASASAPPESCAPDLLVINCMISSEGAATDCRVEKSLSPMREISDFERAAISAIMSQRHRPGTRDGKPIDARNTFNISVTPRGCPPVSAPPATEPK